MWIRLERTNQVWLNERKKEEEIRRHSWPKTIFNWCIAAAGVRWSPFASFGCCERSLTANNLQNDFFLLFFLSKMHFSLSFISIFFLFVSIYRIGLSGFDNPMRDPKTDELKRHIGLVRIQNCNPMHFSHLNIFNVKHEKLWCSCLLPPAVRIRPIRMQIKRFEIANRQLEIARQLMMIGGEM